VIAAMLSRLIGMVEWTDASGKRNLKGFLVDSVLKPGLSPSNVSLVYGLIFVAACYVPVYLMHRNRIYLKA
jgi:predicted acyltransferase